MTNTFCVVPWHGLEIDLATGRQQVCCWMTGPEISRTSLQQQFLQGQQPMQCQKCWDSEHRGLESRRQMENRFLDYKMDRDISNLEHDAVMGKSKINLLQIYVGSLCNASCATCGPSCSSTWQRMLGQQKSYRIEQLDVTNNFDHICNHINWSELQRINILGGEPFLIRNSWKILEKLRDANNRSCRVCFVTNGSIVPTIEQRELLQWFTDISCCVSIDAVGREFEYLRYPLQWSEILANLDVYREIFAETTVSYTVSNLNYHSRDTTLSWFRDQGLLYIENYVQHPPWFDHRVAPGHQLWPDFVREVSKQDFLKSISIKDYIPYVAQLIDTNPGVQG